MDPRALLARVVVDEPDRPEAQLRVAQDLPQQQHTAVAGTDDQDRARVAARAVPAQRPLVEHVHQEPRSADEHEHHQPVEHQHAERHRDRPEAAVELQPRFHERDVDHERERRDQARLRDLQVVALRRVPHPVPVDPDSAKTNTPPITTNEIVRSNRPEYRSGRSPSKRTQYAR